jgi:hypothetical protein
VEHLTKKKEKKKGKGSWFQAAVAPLFSSVSAVLLPPVSVTLLLYFLFRFRWLAFLFLLPFLMVRGCCQWWLRAVLVAATRKVFDGGGAVSNQGK